MYGRIVLGAWGGCLEVLLWGGRYVGAWVCLGWGGVKCACEGGGGLCVRGGVGHFVHAISMQLEEQILHLILAN